MTQLIEPETNRLRLRQWRAGDREPFAELNADPRVREFFPNRMDRSASDALAQRLETFIAEHGRGLWAVERKGSCDFIGFVGLSIPPEEIPYAPCVEVGWRLAHRYWGRISADQWAANAP